MAANPPKPYGRTEADWKTLTEAGLKFLVEQARKKRYPTYTELNEVLQKRTGLPRFDFALELDRAAMGHLLYLIVEEERPKSHHMISSIVLYLNENDAGSGFYRLAESYGLLPPKASAEEKDAFWSGEVNAIHHYYESH